MSRTKRSASFLLLAGLLSAGFFWITDPALGYARLYDTTGQLNPIDAIHQAWPGTLVGFLGSAIVLTVGGWLMMREVR
ncbi:MAG: hypothetical protein AAF743_03965 [Planctomycetota bacterium]